MIHQFIFASPRPGMTEPAFQHYWLHIHAPRYAVKIPQIHEYLVDTRIALPGDVREPLWSGVAEIWLENEQEQIASLQSKEFLEGARIDEPNWAAFWRTLVLDTTAHPLFRDGSDPGGVKLLVLSKRKQGTPLKVFRAHCLGPHAATVARLPGLRRYVQGHVRDAAYAVGESVLDCVEQLWFDDVDALVAARSSRQQDDVRSHYRLMAEERYLHEMLVEEHPILGPGRRRLDGLTRRPVAAGGR